MKQPPLFRFFPHISLLGQGDAKTATLTSNPRLTMGCGIGLANALALGVGVPLNEPLSHAYLMAGLSLPDIVDLAF
jgi:Na+-transporting NADH:ubiquinone oxidoreductase subunit NqrE